MNNEYFVFTVKLDNGEEEKYGTLKVDSKGNKVDLEEAKLSLLEKLQGEAKKVEIINVNTAYLVERGINNG